MKEIIVELPEDESYCILYSIPKSGIVNQLANLNEDKEYVIETCRQYQTNYPENTYQVVKKKMVCTIIEDWQRI